MPFSKTSLGALYAKYCWNKTFKRHECQIISLSLTVWFAFEFGYLHAKFEIQPYLAWETMSPRERERKGTRFEGRHTKHAYYFFCHHIK